MDLFTFLNLLTPLGQEALAAAVELTPREANFLSFLESLRRQYPRELAKASLEIAILRGEAIKKFPDAHRMYFVREALEQASSYQVSSFRAKRYKGYERIVDLGCSIGGDTLTLGAMAPTIGIDRDPLRLAIAQENLRVLGQGANFLLADLSENLPLGGLSPSRVGLFFDPSRRTDHGRVFSVNNYSPPLSIIKEWQGKYPSLGVKISPGVRFSEIKEYDAEVEFISFKGELKEAVLWFGPMKTATRRATILPENQTMMVDSTSILPETLSEPLQYLYEPDPAILRAGLVRDLANEITGYQLDADIAYLTTSRKVTTSFARGWEVEDWFPFGLKRLRSYLRERQVGQVVIKKRGSPLQPESLRRELRLKGDSQRLVVLTHLQGRPIVVVCLVNDII